MAFLSGVVLAAAVCLASAVKNVERSDYCKSSVKQNLDIQKLKGDWWEQESYSANTLTGARDKCSVSHFYPEANNKMIHVINDYFKYSTMIIKHVRWSYTISNEDPTDDGNLVLKNALGKKSAEYDILDTDYENFMIIQICHDTPEDERIKLGSILVRNNNGIDLNNAEIKPHIDAALSKNKFDRSAFEVYDIKSCKPVSFPESFDAKPESKRKHRPFFSS